MVYNIRNVSVFTDKTVDLNSRVTWMIHNVFDDISFKDGRMDHHSHGLDTLFDKELQITIAINPSVAGYIINTLGILGTTGVVLKDGDTVVGLFEDPDMKVDIKDAVDCDGNPILRIYLPDENNNTLNSTVYPYSEQAENPYL